MLPLYLSSYLRYDRIIRYPRGKIKYVKEARFPRLLSVGLLAVLLILVIVLIVVVLIVVLVLVVVLVVVLHVSRPPFRRSATGHSVAARRKKYTEKKKFA